MPLTWPAKDPDEFLDYGIDWTPRLESSETIVSALWIPPPGVTTSNASWGDKVTVIWVAGGSHGVTYLFTNRITTSAGRILEETAKLKVKNR
jgi:hypothetical protein